MILDDRDHKQIADHGVGAETIERQLDNFRKGFPYLNVEKAAVAGDGVVAASEAERSKFAEIYEKGSAPRRIVKFVPASGAASRMFKELFAFVNGGPRTAGIDKFLGNLDRFAFAQKLRAILPEGADDRMTVARVVKDGLAYGSKPKGVILFHRYDDEVRTAVEEHLVEGAMYAACGGKVNIHFTVSPEHRAVFDEVIAAAVPKFEGRYGVKYDISFSVQKPSTDTIAVNPDLTPFRNSDGSLLFRPAGHGALIENLGEIDADIVFIKNIDNVTTDSRKADTCEYKKVVAGMLIALQEEAFAHLRAMDEGKADVAAAARFAEEKLCVKLPEEADEKTVRAILDRPVRVCGMVRNEGEPGGGPFWVRNADGTVSLQIAEPSQIAPEAAHLLKEGAYFNPVDLVCGIRDYRGRRFDLARYVDPETGFISQKSSEGRELLAQELPGLWNGAMSRWNTVFVEVPLSTFTPVKEVNDLLRPEHQS